MFKRTPKSRELHHLNEILFINIWLTLLNSLILFQRVLINIEKNRRKNQKNSLRLRATFKPLKFYLNNFRKRYVYWTREPRQQFKRWPPKLLTQTNFLNQGKFWIQLFYSFPSFLAPLFHSFISFSLFHIYCYIYIYIYVISSSYSTQSSRYDIILCSCSVVRSYKWKRSQKPMR